MNIETHQLANLNGQILDLDLLPNGDFISVLDTGKEKLLSWNGLICQIPPIRFPIVRAVDNGIAVLLDSRTLTDTKNAWLITETGKALKEFDAGDGIEDVIVLNKHIVVTYFDEGVCGHGIGSEGINVFRINGYFEFGYRSHFGEEAEEIADCYCACRCGNRVVFFSYTDFTLVDLDVSKRKQAKYGVPEELHGCHALTVKGNEAYLYSPYGDQEGKIYRLNLGERRADLVGKYPGLLRGLEQGRFIAIKGSSYDIISFD